MLVLSRKCGEKIQIGDQISISIVKIDGGKVRIGIEAPPDVQILREELLSGHQPAGPVRAQPDRRILIIDDCAEDRQVFRRLIAAHDATRYSFSEADSGGRGLDLCRKEAPDCILLDYSLPDLDGLQFLNELKRDPPGPPIPVIMVTGYGTESIAMQALKSGACEYLAKQELSRERLQRAVHEALRLSPAPAAHLSN